MQCPVAVPSREGCDSKWRAAACGTQAVTVRWYFRCRSNLTGKPTDAAAMVGEATQHRLLVYLVFQMA
jgi:hypothetical protein